MFEVESKKKWDFTIIENQILESENVLSNYEKLTYVMLCMYSNRDKSKPVYPSHERLARQVGCSKSSVIRSLKGLAEKGLIRIEQQFKENGGQASNIYYLLEIDETLVLSMSEGIGGHVTETMGACQTDNGGMSQRHTNKSNNNKNKNNEIKEKKKDITANAEKSSNTLFNIPSVISDKELTKEELSLSKIDKAIQTGNWKKVTDTDFVHYFTLKHNEIFPVKISRTNSKEGNFLVSVFKKNFIERYQIERVDICSKIKQILEAYRSTELNPEYRDCFSLETFKLEWKIDQLMKSIERMDEYGSTLRSENRASDDNSKDVPDVF